MKVTIPNMVSSLTKRSTVATGIVSMLYLIHSYTFVTNDFTERRLEEAAQDVNSLGVRAFNAWNRTNLQFPCVPESSPDTEGIFYIKIPKTSSSSLGKITARIAGREAKRQGLQWSEACKVYDPYLLHQSAYNLNCKNRNKSKSFLWTVIRSPSSRAISHYNMILNHGKVDTQFGTFKNTLEKDRDRFCASKQLGFMHPNYEHEIFQGEQDYPAHVKYVMGEYNFIGIYERLYESLVVLSLLIGAGVSDFLFDWLPTEHSRCGVLSDPEWVTPEMKGFVESSQWREMQEGDFLLYDVVNRSLDLTIEKLGKDVVARELQKFLRLISIGTQAGNKIAGEPGCGVPGINHRQTPYADIDELNWFTTLSLEDQQFVKSCK